MKKALVFILILALLGAGGYYYYFHYLGNETPSFLVTATPTPVPCEHEWAPATCMIAETCIKCSATQGEPIPHVWGSTSCVDPQPCIICGTSEGLVPEHQWQENAHICEVCGVDMRSVDERFVASLVAGLEDRWKMTDAYLARLEAQSYAEAIRTSTNKKYVQRIFPQEEMLKYLQAEYDQIIDYKEMLFENEEFGNWAYRYIDGLLASIEEMNELTDSTHWVDQYTRIGFHEQTLALYMIDQTIPVIVDEDYADELAELLENGHLIDAMNTLLDMTAFQNILTLTDGRDRFEAIVKNTTGYKFKTFSYEVNLLDENNEVLDTRILDGDDWEPNQVKRFNLVAPHGTTQVVVVGVDWMFEEE